MFRDLQSQFRVSLPNNITTLNAVYIIITVSYAYFTGKLRLCVVYFKLVFMCLPVDCPELRVLSTYAIIHYQFELLDKLIALTEFHAWICARVKVKKPNKHYHFFPSLDLTLK
jgi:hypothetical protein